MKHTLSWILSTHITLFTTSIITSFLRKLPQELRKGFTATRCVRKGIETVPGTGSIQDDIHKSTLPFPK